MSSKTKTATRRERVYDILKSRKWVAGYELTKPETGGSEGLRRLRELRAAGWEIEARKLPDSNAYEYRLVGRA